jgi:hypothetical protein
MINDIVPLQSRKVMISKEIANSRFNLDVSQMSIFLCAIGKLAQSKVLDSDTWHEVTAVEYAKVRNVSYEAGVIALERAAEDLWDSYFYTIDAETGKEIRNRWIISLKESEVKGIRFKFHPDIIPFISQLDNYFTAKLVEVGNFKHKMSYQIYFLIMGNKRFPKQLAGELEVNIKEFLVKTGMVGSSYENYKTLNGMVLKPAIKELVDKRLFISLELDRKRGSDSFKLVWRIREGDTKSSLGRV